ncbi:hypothetical protein VTN96DRAFT_4406 [Rasamsonia emersonii]
MDVIKGSCLDRMSIKKSSRTVLFVNCKSVWGNTNGRQAGICTGDKVRHYTRSVIIRLEHTLATTHWESPGLLLTEFHRSTFHLISQVLAMT